MCQSLWHAYWAAGWAHCFLFVTRVGRGVFKTGSVGGVCAGAFVTCHFVGLLWSFCHEYVRFILKKSQGISLNIINL